MTPEPVLLTADEVAAIARVDPESVRRWARERRIAAITLPGGQKRFRREDVDKFLTPAAPIEAAS